MGSRVPYQSRKKRAALYGLPCHYCTVPATTADHIIPLNLGGSDETWNLVPACRDCNAAKSQDWPTCSCSVCAESVRRHLEVDGPTILAAIEAAERVALAGSEAGRLQMLRSGARAERYAVAAADIRRRLT